MCGNFDNACAAIYANQKTRTWKFPKSLHVLIIIKYGKYSSKLKMSTYPAPNTSSLSGAVTKDKCIFAPCRKPSLIFTDKRVALESIIYTKLMLIQYIRISVELMDAPRNITIRGWKMLRGSIVPYTITKYTINNKVMAWKQICFKVALWPWPWR